MDFNEVITVFKPPLSSKIVVYAVRPTTIWTLLSDSSICIFKRSNPRVFSKFPFDGHDPSTAKMSVDDMGEKCVIYWDRLPILFFSRATGFVCELSNIKLSFHPTAACWITLPGKSPSILVGSLVGELIMISSDEEHEVKELYTFSETVTIRELHAHVDGDVKMIFALVHEQVQTFITAGPFEDIFQSDKSNKVLILGEVESNCQVDHRLSIDTFDGVVRLSALHMLGVVSFTATQRANGSFDFNQTVMEVDTTNAVSFGFCPLGLLIVLERNILLMSDSKPKASLPMSLVQNIATDEKGLVLFRDDDIINVPIKGLRTYIVKKAVKQKDYSYALEIARNDPIKFFVLNKQVEKLDINKIGPYILSLKWTVKEVAASVGLESVPMLFYLRELLKKGICKERVKQRLAVINWAFNLHVSFYPKYEKEFIDFIEDYGTEMNPKTVYNRLYEISFDKGVNAFAETTGDHKSIANHHIVLSTKQDALQYISKLDDMNVISDTLIRMLKTYPDDVKNFMLKNSLKLTIDHSLPILAHMSDIAHNVIPNYPKDDLNFALLLVAFCANHQDDKIIQLMNINRSKMNFILRFANSYECYAAAARILVKMDQPKLAVRVAMKVSLSYANSLLFTINDTKMQKEAWVELLTIVPPEEREKALTRVMASHLFTFEELIDVIGDDSFLYEFTDDMLNAVADLEKESEIVHYRVHFKPVTAGNFPISYEEGCCLCQLPLLGTNFVAFPCGHKIHNSCLEKCVQELCVHKENDIGALDSCPICGINSIETALQPFDE